MLTEKCRARAVAHKELGNIPRKVVPRGHIGSDRIHRIHWRPPDRRGSHHHHPPTSSRTGPLKNVRLKQTFRSRSGRVRSGLVAPQGRNRGAIGPRDSNRHRLICSPLPWGPSALPFAGDFGGGQLVRANCGIRAGDLLIHSPGAPAEPASGSSSSSFLSRPPRPRQQSRDLPASGGCNCSLLLIAPEPPRRPRLKSRPGLGQGPTGAGSTGDRRIGPIHEAHSHSFPWPWPIRVPISIASPIPGICNRRPLLVCSYFYSSHLGHPPRPLCGASLKLGPRRVVELFPPLGPAGRIPASSARPWGVINEKRKYSNNRSPSGGQFDLGPAIVPFTERAPRLRRRRAKGEPPTLVGGATLGRCATGGPRQVAHRWRSAPGSGVARPAPASKGFRGDGGAAGRLIAAGRSPGNHLLLAA